MIRKFCMCGCGEHVVPGNRYVRFHYLRVKTAMHLKKIRAMLPRARKSIDQEKRKALAGTAQGRPEVRIKRAIAWQNTRNPRWNKKGKFLGKNGRVYVRPVELEFNGSWIEETHLIAFKTLGRRLKKGEVVHHVDEVKSNNKHSNLVICTDSYHRSIHARTRKYQPWERRS